MVLVALRELVDVLTRPRNLVATPAPMVTDSGAGARIFDAIRASELGDSDIASVSIRIFDCVLVTVDDIVTVSVKLLNMFCAPAFALVTASATVMT